MTKLIPFQNEMRQAGCTKSEEQASFTFPRKNTVELCGHKNTSYLKPTIMAPFKHLLGTHMLRVVSTLPSPEQSAGQKAVSSSLPR